MKNVILRLIPLACLTLAACSGANKALEAKVASQPPVESGSQVRTEADRLIRSEPGLSDEQKQKLLSLRTSVSSQLDEIRDHSLRLRSVLVEELLSPSYDMDEVSLIKKRLKKLEKKRLSLLFDSVDEANEILGHQAQGHATLMRALLNQRPDDVQRGRE